MSKARIRRLERWARQSLSVRLNWVGIDVDGTVLHGPQPEIIPWIGRQFDELPVNIKLYLTGAIPGEIPFHPDLA